MKLIRALCFSIRWLVEEQNWWADMPYVEVDLMYLVSCQAEIIFISGSQLQMGDFDGSYADYAENSEGIDTAEQFLRDGPLHRIVISSEE